MSRMLVCAVVLLLAPAEHGGSEAGQPVAYSLKVARKKIEQTRGNWRRTQPGVYNLAGLTDIAGFVVDTATDDLILIGHRRAGQVSLTLDDLVVALRAKFVYDDWPSVRLDKRNHGGVQLRFRGGLEDTGFGQTLADASGKIMAMVGELSHPKNSGDRQAGRQINGGLLYQLYLTAPHTERCELVCLVGDIRADQVQTETVRGSPQSQEDDPQGGADAPYSRDVTERFIQLSSTHQSLGKLRGLLGLVAVSVAVGELQQRAFLTWWLEKYPLKRAATPRDGNPKSRLQGASHAVEIRMISAGTRTRSLDENTSRETVLQARRSEDELSWAFERYEWGSNDRDTPSGGQSTLLPGVRALLSQGRFPAAVSALDQVLPGNPEMAEAWKLKAAALAQLYRDQEGLDCLERALDLSPRDYGSWRSKAQLLSRLGQNEGALVAVDRALELNPSNAGAWQEKAVVLTRLRRVPETLDCYNRALELNPLNAVVWRLKALALATLGRYNEALASLANTLRIDPLDGEAWYNQALYLAVLGRHSEAKTAMAKAAEVGHEVARQVLEDTK